MRFVIAMPILVISGSPSRRLSRSSALLDCVAARLALAGAEVDAVGIGRVTVCRAAAAPAMPWPTPPRERCSA